MLKSQIYNFNESFKSINEIAMTSLGDNDWDITTDITKLIYHGDDDVIEFMEATILTKIEHNKTCLIIETKGTREVFGSDLGHYEFNETNANIYSTSPNTDFSSHKPFNRELTPHIKDSDINASNLTLFIALPSPHDRAKKFKGTISI
ncbi:hypothetical protein P8H27_02010 [Pseudomonas sp. sp1636]|uniref:hypothetical protein n=1 Tax=Pseudomonas sp. sp1636 TaxID=3036707 RepID=UPI0025A503CC|nr:hypothetical protein [Pseudomonas sp. sp1636]MDM8347674.1 hypothetical protein [Pseudomonas sp. sp1636]